MSVDSSIRAHRMPPRSVPNLIGKKSAEPARLCEQLTTELARATGTSREVVLLRMTGETDWSVICHACGFEPDDSERE